MSCEHGCNGCDECTDYYGDTRLRKDMAYRAMEVSLLRIAEYPKQRGDELSIDGAREIARAALAYCRERMNGRDAD